MKHLYVNTCTYMHTHGVCDLTHMQTESKEKCIGVDTM